MSKIKNTSQIETYDEPAKPSIKVHSHWNRETLVVLEVGNEKVTVAGEDLIKAINNCMNVGL
jgi:hypothetical protein